MRPQYHIPDWIEDRIIELSVGWLNRLQYKEQTKENYETIIFTLDEHSGLKPPKEGSEG